MPDHEDTGIALECVEHVLVNITACPLTVNTWLPTSSANHN
jgi:hypothetical protein